MNSELLYSHAENTSFYGDRLRTILNRPLSPENIETYAEAALEGLIGLAQAAVDEYQLQPTYDFADDYSRETAAFNYFQLQNIDTILDFVSFKADQINQLDTLIVQAVELPDIIVQPDEYFRPRTGSGNGSETKKVIPRLKTTLFILNNEFDIDLTDPEQITITLGTNADNMMRDESYYFVEAHGLERSFLICDEEGNVSYVFDTSKLAAIGIDSASLKDLRKSELNVLLETNPDVGQRLVYSDTFTSRMLQAIEDPKMSGGIPTDRVQPKKDVERKVTLRPPVGVAPEDFMTLNSMRQTFGVSQNVIERAIRTLQADEVIGEDTVYLFGKNYPYRGYSPDDQQAIQLWLNNNWTHAQNAPDMVLSVNGVSEFFELSPQTIMKGITELRESGAFGEERKYKYGPRITVGLEPEEQNELYDWLKNNQYLVPLPAEGQLSLAGFSKWLGIAETSTLKAVATLQQNRTLDELTYNRFSGNRSQSLSPWEQNIVRDELITTGLIAPPAPEGCLSLMNFAAASNVSPKTLRAVVATMEVNGKLPPASYYKFGSRSALGYTFEQRAVIDSYMKEVGVTAEPAPDGYLSLFGVSNELGTTRAAVKIAISDLEEAAFGPTVIYRFDSVNTTGYSPAQQQSIRNQLVARGAFNLAPTDYLTISSLAKSLNRDPETVLKAVARLEAADELGDVAMYAFSGKVLRGYSPEQRNRLAGELQNYAVNPIDRTEPDPLPEGYRAATHLSKLTGLASERIAAIAKEIDPAVIGQVRRYKVDEVPRKAYSPEQQQLILKELDERGMLSPQAPQNFLSLTAFRYNAKINFAELKAVIAGIAESELGPVVRYRFENNTNPTFAYSPAQQAMILGRLAESRANNGWAPEGFESVVSLARQLNIGTTSIEKAISSIDTETLGPLVTYKFRTKRTIGMSPEQQEIIKQAMIEQNILVPNAPDDVLTRNRIAKSIGTSLTMVLKAVEVLDAEGELSKPRSYRFKDAPRPFRGFSPEDQVKIKQRLAGRRPIK